VWSEAAIPRFAGLPGGRTKRDDADFEPVEDDERGEIPPHGDDIDE
jgi:hypothetical protein